MKTHPRRLAYSALLVPSVLLLILAAPAVRAQTAAAGMDSIASWAGQAKAGFQASVGDSAGGDNYVPYEKVGFIGRRMLRALGRKDLLQAHAIQPALDSLGLDVEVATDPLAPSFALLMVHNSAHPMADAVGFLFWYRGDDLRIQGAVFRGGLHPRMRVWWTGKPEYPYEWGIVVDRHDGTLAFTLLRLSPAGTSWGIEQDEDRTPVLGEPGDAQWADLNRDGMPELVSWTRRATDSLFTECMSCPKLITERTFVEGGHGFEMLDQRLVPTPYATLVYFVRLLVDGKAAQAGRLLRDPARVRDAIAQGWNRRVVRSPWYVESTESGQSWPRRLGLRFQGPQGVKRYDVVFAMREGRWIIEDWFEPKPVERHYPSVTMPPAKPPGPTGAKTPAGTKKPAAKPPAKAPVKR